MGCHLMKPAPWQVLFVQPGLCCAVPQLEVNKPPKGKPFSGFAGGSQYRRPLPSCNLRARAQACCASQCPHQEDDGYNILSRMSFPSSLCEREPDFMLAPRHEDAAAQPACGTGNRFLQAFTWLPPEDGALAAGVRVGLGAAAALCPGAAALCGDMAASPAAAWAAGLLV